MPRNECHIKLVRNMPMGPVPGWNKTYRLCLESLDRLDMRAHVVRNGLEIAEDLLRLIHDSLVLKDGAVVLEVDGGRLRGVLSIDALSVRVPLAEGLESRDRL